MTVVHDTAQNSSDNFPSYLPVSQKCVPTALCKLRVHWAENNEASSLKQLKRLIGDVTHFLQHRICNALITLIYRATFSKMRRPSTYCHRQKFFRKRL